MGTQKKDFSWWCDRAWIKFGFVISIITMVVVLILWNSISTEVKVIAAIGALIPLHVIEEWVFPGGFHYQYNNAMKSDAPNCYPMNRASDMITNLVATVLFLVLAIYGACAGSMPAGVLIGAVAFCALEGTLHTVFGIAMYAKFKDAGKTTIYGPGSITAYFGFVPFGVISLYQLVGVPITGIDWAIGIGILAFIAVVCILIPENILKSKDTPYAFKNAGYFERFMR